ncbi:hypothetical protein HDV04_005932 [Boothiomyces sp. JEL0838]|nr:hypothetical protein HDV04_005932 [Boothiomyces sp. JEL0838]
MSETTVLKLANEMPQSQGFTLAWENLGYTVKDKNGNPKTVLSNLNGIVKPGSVVAVLGASGAGKSSFLNTLAGRNPSAHVTGQVTINGRTDISMKHASRYCTQEEALFGNLTVYETLMYAADFNLPDTTPKQKKHEIVMELISDFGLETVKNTIIGTPLMKGCSGGQVRRVSVASQMIGLKGGILFLDEPTSGLDSVAAGAIINIVRNIASRENTTVICTIHQPSTETFELFSHMLLLGQGQTVYFGPREEAITYFETVGHPIPVRANPSDVYLLLTNVDFDEDLEAGKDRLVALTAAYQKSAQNLRVLSEIKQLNANPLPYEKGSVGYANGVFHQTKTLLLRALLNATKNPLSYWIRVAMYVCLAILMGTTWLRMGVYQTTVTDRLAGLFFAVAFLSFMAVAGIPAFLEERHVFMRESANGLYGVGSYVLSNTLISIPFIFIISISFSLVAYFLMGLQQEADRFFVFVGYLFLSLMIAEAQTVFISVAIPIFVAALTITAFANGLWMVVQGFFVQKTNIPAFWRYSFHQIDFQKYAYELLVDNEFRGLTFDCAGVAPNCACMYQSSLNNTCQFSGEDVLRHYDYADISYYKWSLIMIAIFLFFKIATYLVLKIQASR